MPTYLYIGMLPRSAAPGTIMREPITMSACPVSSGVSRSCITSGAYCPSPCSSTTMSRPRSMAYMYPRGLVAAVHQVDRVLEHRKLGPRQLARARLARRRACASWLASSKTKISSILSTIASGMRSSTLRSVDSALYATTRIPIRGLRAASGAAGLSVRGADHRLGGQNSAGKVRHGALLIEKLQKGDWLAPAPHVHTRSGGGWSWLIRS